MSSGIYFHIPFCHRRCIYCDFYLTTNLKLRDKFISALTLEMKLISGKIGNEKIHSVFFGGGTPSVLEKNHYEIILNTLYDNFNLDKSAEISIECNPGDILRNPELFDYLNQNGINRISIGVQSFIDKELKFLTREHTANDAIESVKIAKKYSDNINIDLIYSLQNQTLENLQYNLDKFYTLNIPHLSAYTLTYEKGTLLYKKFGNINLSENKNEKDGEMYEFVYKSLENNGYNHYEVSNFAKTGFESLHNLGYWNFNEYLGLGPSSHSFYKNKRWNNKKDISKYITQLNDNTLPIENDEILTTEQLRIDYLLCTLRSKGVNLNYYKEIFKDNFREQYKNYIDNLISSNLGYFAEGYFRLTSRGYQIADEIILNFMKE